MKENRRAWRLDIGFFGCFVEIIGIILFCWAITHVREIFAALDRLIA